MMNARESALIEAIGKTIVDEVAHALEPVKTQLGRLELKLEYAELQAKELRYAGVWNEKSIYRKNNFVTHGSRRAVSKDANRDDFDRVPQLGIEHGPIRERGRRSDPYG